MGLFDRRQDGPSTRLVLEVPLNGNLDKVLRSFVVAISTIGTGLQAIALALSTPQDNSTEVQRKLDEATAQLRVSTNALDATVRANQPKEEN
jgi:hypothetical protein